LEHQIWGRAHDNKGSKARCIIAGVDSDDKAAPGERPYMTAQCEVNMLTDYETFCYAFKIGAKIMMDVPTRET
jgi:hypothetical protein